MGGKSVVFRIWRYRPGDEDPGRFQDFEIIVRPEMTVLEGLDEIRLTRDADLMYRRSCHHASCGTCACTINGNPALACTTRIAALKTDVITLTPLANHSCIGDLAVDANEFFEELDAGWGNHTPCRDASAQRTPEGIDQLLRFDNCIECGCCVAACPVVPDAPEFLGPAVLAALNNESRRYPEKEKSLLRIAAGPHGAAECRRHLACSRVCPAAVYPARHIADLQREIDKRK